MSLIEKHIEKVGMRYPIANVKAEVDRMYGVKGFPHSALVDASGRVIWKGHPAALPKDQIKSALEAATFVPQPEGSQYKSLNKAIAKRQFGKAWETAVKALEKGDDDGFQSVKDALESLQQRMSERAAAAEAAGDYAAAWSVYSELDDLFQWLDSAKVAKERVKALESLDAAKDEIAGWERLLKAEEQAAEGDFEKAAKTYAAIAKKWPGTKAARESQEFLLRHPL